MTYTRGQLSSKVTQELLAYAKRNKNAGVSFKSGSAWIRCPYHANGRERTPSMKVTINPNEKRFFTFHCFGCKKHGRWPELARTIACNPIVSNESQEIYDEQIIPLFNDRDIFDLAAGSKEVVEPDGLPWSEETKWRNIDGTVVHAVGGILFVDTIYLKEDGKTNVIQKDRVFFPLRENGILCGGVRANITSEEGGNYFNTAGMQSARHLLFYDTSSTLLDRDETRVMFISEGPRDALTPLQYGYASVCNLGADNSWSKHKINLILALRPDVLIMAFDGDDPGRQCAHAVYNDLSELVPTYDVVFPTVKVDGKNVKKYDLSDLSQDRVDGIVDDACAQYNLPIPRPYEWKRAVKSKWAV